ncbi:GNAT family N-acetyltransferase [Kordiimonas marina]|uniref:GNAT family N-acetyltransferase n=1 Tax=Kordiimonas marina TaxID=2872312 RepID=UPI001FF6C4B9|nr:GNAT family N-acetyltransferase [Kordiimonas marina]MCJ9428226.1 GNAT family N-acetyltransferase [Kordiimonas marina]
MQPDVRPLTPADHTLIGGIIADAFADDPMNLWTFRNVKALKPTFTGLARDLYLKDGFGHVTADGSAGALWLPPGVGKDLSLLSTLSLAYPILRYGGPRAVLRSLAIDAFMTKNHPAEPHYYLFAIGVRPGKQGKGLGGLVMRQALKAIDAAHMPAYLENSKRDNLGFYQNHGFELMEEVTPVKGSPPLWRMWRKAR